MRGEGVPLKDPMIAAMGWVWVWCWRRVIDYKE